MKTITNKEIHEKLNGDNNFSKCNLAGADLTRADLRGADLRGTIIDYSCWPLWCGTKGVKVDARIFQQLLGHLLVLDVNDENCKKIQKMNTLLQEARKGHRAKDLGLLEGEE